MKTTYRIPMNEQYAYIEIEGDEGSFEEAYAKYQSITKMVKGGAGLPDKEFDAFVQRQIMGEANHTDDLERLNIEQAKMMQILKRAIARIEYKSAQELKALEDKAKQL